MNVGRTADRPWAALQGYDGQQTSEYNAGVTKLQQYKKGTDWMPMQIKCTCEIQNIVPFEMTPKTVIRRLAD